MPRANAYISPLNWSWLTPLYDRFIPLMMPEIALKRRLIEQAHVESGQRVLDVGSGTATLTIMIKQAHPGADVVGIDGDAAVLEIARVQANAAGATIRLDYGLATRLPYDDASFDQVFSSLMFHHLNGDDKLLALSEIWRVLRPGAELHILDFGKPRGVPAYLISLVMRRLEHTADNISGLLPDMMRKSGLSQVGETFHCLSIVGTLSLYSGQKDADAALER